MVKSSEATCVVWDSGSSDRTPDDVLGQRPCYVSAQDPWSRKVRPGVGLPSPLGIILAGHAPVLLGEGGGITHTHTCWWTL